MFNISEDKKHMKSSWISALGKKNVNEKKPWGEEIKWGGFEGIHGKILLIRQGHRTSLKFHNLKSEILFIRSGEVMITYGNECSVEDLKHNPLTTEKVGPRSTFFVQSGCPYRIEAITDCEIIEIGNYMSDIPVRLEDDYGRAAKKDKDISQSS